MVISPNLLDQYIPVTAGILLQIRTNTLVRQTPSITAEKNTISRATHNQSGVPQRNRHKRESPYQKTPKVNPPIIASICRAENDVYSSKLLSFFPMLPLLPRETCICLDVSLCSSLSFCVRPFMWGNVICVACQTVFPRKETVKGFPHLKTENFYPFSRLSASYVKGELNSFYSRYAQPKYAREHAVWLITETGYSSI